MVLRICKLVIFDEITQVSLTKKGIDFQEDLLNICKLLCAILSIEIDLIDVIIVKSYLEFLLTLDNSIC
jgi:hypothetical protein